uniref:Zgc:154006 n=1 Tax=Neolamprologus brichardi TaxID=32507 RepID=A0A3Q4M4B9_NEOBR
MSSLFHGPPVYSPPYSTNSHSLYPPRSVQSPRSQNVPYTYYVPPESYYMEGKPQHFYRWFSPPGFVKTFQGATVLMCFLIFALVASTLVWDMNRFGYGGYGVVDTGSVGGLGSGYYGGSYGYGGSYMTPQSAKAAMISMCAINFLVSLGFLVASFSRSRSIRTCRFYLTVFICDIILGIIDIIFVIGVNPMSQSSQSMLYNPMLMMCQNIQGSPSLSGSVGAGFPGGFPLFNQYLQHYCYMDPEEAVAFVLGLLVVVALSFSAYFAYKTRSKIWRHGKANIHWDEDVARPSEGFSANKSKTRGVEPLYQNCRAIVCSSSSSDESDSIRPPPYYMKKERKKDREPMPAAQVMIESQYETGYTTGDTGNGLDRDHTDYLYRLYPEITSDEQRRRYKKDFDSDLSRYKILCSELDDISDKMHKLSRELDALEEDSMKYQVEKNRNKVHRTPEYQAKKKQSKELRQKLFHIKHLVKIYDQGFC